MIRRTERGLLVTELIGMGFNPVTGDYSRGAAGLWIEDGRVVHAVEEITIAGNLGDMLAAIDLVGSDLLWAGAHRRADRAHRDDDGRGELKLRRQRPTR